MTVLKVDLVVVVRAVVLVVLLVMQALHQVGQVLKM
jgi:hypothetical protein